MTKIYTFTRIINSLSKKHDVKIYSNRIEVLKGILAVVTYFCVLVQLYLYFSFYNLSFNIKEWPLGSRFLFALLWFFTDILFSIVLIVRFKILSIIF